jgi:hypothetical protein
MRAKCKFLGLAALIAILRKDTNMKALLKALLTICVSASAFSALAVEKIEGAFGKKLGEAFDPSSATGTSTNSEGGIMYEFTPTNAVRSFKRYYVMITPTTHKIYCVVAIGNVVSTTAGRKEQSVIMGVLREKYGSEFKIGPTDSMGDVKRIQQGSRNIVTTLSGYPNHIIDLKCHDDDLEKLAEKEHVAKEIGSIEKSGL